MKKILHITFLFVVSWSLKSQVVWYGNPDQSVNTNFRRFDRGNYPQDECNGGDGSEQSSVGTVNDPVYGKVWRIHKPKKRKRGEFARTSYIPKNGETLYYGWRWKIESTPDLTSGIAVFQWKSAAGGGQESTQNYPLNMGYGNGKLSMNAYGPCYPKWNSCGSRSAQGVTLWSKPVNEGEWVTIVIGMHLSRDDDKGWVELWFNGEKQVLSNSGVNKYSIKKFSADKKRAYHKTFDGQEPYPKWGSYNQNACSFNTYTYYDEMRIGKDLNSVLDPLGGGGNNNTATLSNVSAPSKVITGQDVNVSIDYNTSEERDIVVMFQKDSAPWTLYSESRKTVGAGSGKANFTLSIPANTPVATDEYQFQFYMAPKDKGWGDKLADGQIRDVDVEEPEVKEPYFGSPTVLPGMLQMEHYDKGGQGVSYNDTDAENKGGNNFREGDGVDIATKNGGRTIGYNADGEWLEYTVDVEEAGSYEMIMTIASKNGGGKMGIDINGNQALTNVSIPSTGDWDTFNEFTQSINLPAGEHVLRFNIETRGFDFDKILFQKSTVTNLSGAENIKGFTVFPNPSKSGFYRLSQVTEYVVMDSQGRVVKSSTSDIVNLKDESRGIYILQIGEKQFKLMK